MKNGLVRKVAEFAVEGAIVLGLTGSVAGCGKPKEPEYVARINKITNQDMSETKNRMLRFYQSIDLKHLTEKQKSYLADFKNKPENWREIRFDEVPGWDLRKVFPEGMAKHCSQELVDKSGFYK